MASIDAQEQLTKETIGLNARDYNTVNFKSLATYRDFIQNCNVLKGLNVAVYMHCESIFRKHVGPGKNFRAKGFNSEIDIW